jgi:two-component system CheB/CheR fusion protein
MKKKKQNNLIPKSDKDSDVNLTKASVPLKKSEKEEDDLVVVGIGASAGGLEALRLLFPKLSLEANMTYVIAQHLDPTHRSMLVQLLARNTSMNVVEVKDGQEPKANTIYITPPDKDVTILHGVLHLSKPSTSIGPKPSIDYFFTSLAEDKAEKAVGIILSGTGSDGSHGIRAIKAGGGITIVQDEKTARYNGMPHAAIETGHVDLVLSPEKIGPELLSIIKYPHIKPLSARYEKAPDNKLQKIFNLLLERHGCDFSNYKPTTINRRIERRMAVHKLDRLEEYILYLEHSNHELDLLYKDILISVTGFFRDAEAFKALEMVISNIIEAKEGNDTIRIWVPGCATGEEAYTIAILFAERLRNSMSHFNFQIFGTDIDNDAIIRARRAVYSQASIVDVDKNIVDKYFVREDSTFQVVKSIREMVVFARQDLVKDPPFSHLDLISCRNVLIYFNSYLQRRIIPVFQYSLNPGGYLLLGKSESIGQFDDLFIPINKKWKIYKRRGHTRTPPITFSSLFPPNKKYTPAYQKYYTKEKEISIRDLFNNVIAKNYGPSGIVINDRLEIIHIKGDVNPYFTLVPGDTDLNILTMARDEIRLELRTLIHKSSRENISVRSKRLKIIYNNEIKYVTLSIIPVSVKQEVENLTAILFEEETPDKDAPIEDKVSTEKDADPRIIELEQELTATKEHLQTTVEELETANEELQSMNEELQSANEELQSSNEELETSNEELQSTNEELTTVNEEFQVKSAELASAYSDLQNIQTRIGIALIVVDVALKITRFTPPAADIFDIRADNIGHVITTVGCHFDLTNLRKDLLEVIRKGKTIEQELTGDDKTYWMVIYPYYSEHKQIAGAIIIFFDKTNIKKAELVQKEKEEQFEMIQEVANVASWTWNIETDSFEYSKHFESLLGLQPGEFKGTYHDFISIIHPEDRKLAIQFFDKCKTKKKDCKIEHRIILPDKTIRWISETGCSIVDKKERIIKIIAIIVDITDIKRTNERIIQEKVLLDALDDEVCVIDNDYRVISANSAFLETYGSGNEIFGKKCFEVIHGTNTLCEGSHYHYPLKTAYETKLSTSFIHSHPTKDGKERHVTVAISPIFNTEGNVDRFIHISKITP